MVLGDLQEHFVLGWAQLRVLALSVLCSETDHFE